MKTIINIITNKKIVSLFSLVILMSLPALAQDGFGDGGGDVPVDGGLSLLVAAGVGYGAKKIRAYKHEKQNQ